MIKKKILGIILGWNKKPFLVYYLCLKSFGNNKKNWMSYCNTTQGNPGSHMFNWMFDPHIIFLQVIKTFDKL